MAEDFRKDKDAFAREAYRYRSVMLRLAQLKLGSSDDAEDAVDETIIRAADRAEQLRDISRMEYWLRRILLNRCNEIIRSRKQHASMEEVEPYTGDPSDTSDPAGQAELVEQIERILDLMLFIEPEEHSEVLVLYYYQKKSYEDMAEELGVPVGTVKSRLNRARETLQASMKREGITLADLEKIKDLSRWPEIRFGY